MEGVGLPTGEGRDDLTLRPGGVGGMVEAEGVCREAGGAGAHELGGERG